MRQIIAFSVRLERRNSDRNGAGGVVDLTFSNISMENGHEENVLT